MSNIEKKDKLVKLTLGLKRGSLQKIDDNYSEWCHADFKMEMYVEQDAEKIAEAQEILREEVSKELGRSEKKVYEATRLVKSQIDENELDSGLGINYKELMK